MALKIFKNITGWDNLDKYYKKTINGVHMQVENFDRVFCRCGCTTSSDGGIIHKCPKCGNTDFIEYRNSENYYLTKRVKYNIDESVLKDKLKVDFVALCPKKKNDRTILDFAIEEGTYYTIDETSILYDPIHSSLFGTKWYDRPERDNNPNDFFKDYPFRDKLEPYAEVLNLNLSLDTIETIFSAKENFHKTIESPLYHQYPYLGVTTVKKLLELKKNGHKIKENLDLKEYLNMFEVMPKAYGIFDYTQKMYLNTSSYYRDMIFSDSYYSSSGVKRYNQEEKNNSKGWKMIYHYIDNHMVTLEEGIQIASHINQLYETKPDFRLFGYDFRFYRNPSEYELLFKKEWLDLLPFYIKENICLRNKDKLIRQFIEDVLTLDKLKIKVCEDNLKVKTLNYFLNLNNMAETYKIPADKVNCFIDLFEKNPAKAIGLIKDRRKITKKQLETFIEAMSD